MSRKKNPDRLLLRDMETPSVLGYELDRETLLPIRQTFSPRIEGEDYGSDPLGDGTFRMVPSGDIVDRAERDRRREKRHKGDR